MYVSPYPVNEPWTKEMVCFVSSTICLYELRVIFDQNKVRFPLLGEWTVNEGNGVFCIVDDMFLWVADVIWSKQGMFPLTRWTNRERRKWSVLYRRRHVFMSFGRYLIKTRYVSLTRWTNRERRKWSVLYRRRHVFMSCGRYLIKTRYVSHYSVNEPWTKETECFVSSTTCFYELRMLFDQNKVRFPLLGER